MVQIDELVGFGEIDCDKSFADLTTLKIGGKIAAVVYPHNEIELISLLQYCKKNHVEHKLLGKGSDLLCTDEAYDGVVIKLDKYFNGISVHQNEMLAEAGTSLIYAAVYAQQHGLSGLEFASGIPGTIGGALFMNAGAYKASMQDVVKEVFVYHEGKIEWLDNTACRFAYRSSLFQSQPDMIILGAKFTLTAGDPTEILRVINDRKARRLASQPLEYPSCGSVFRNPEGNNAWALIDRAGLRGKQIGGAKVSEKHCNFIVNVGGATAKDYLELVSLIQKSVYDKFHVQLETEMEYFKIDDGH